MIWKCLVYLNTLYAAIFQVVITWAELFYGSLYHGPGPKIAQELNTQV